MEGCLFFVDFGVEDGLWEVKGKTEIEWSKAFGATGGRREIWIAPRLNVVSIGR